MSKSPAIMTLLKSESHPLQGPTRNFFFIRLLLFALLASLHIVYIQLSPRTERLYFPFERWPEGRARRVPPPPGSLKPGVHARQMRAAEARLALIREAIVERYMRFHKSQRFNASAPKLIYTGMGNRHGFGDRFRGILHAFQLAILSQRVLLLAWSDPFPLDLVFESAPGVSVMYDPRIDPGPLPLTSEQKKLNKQRGIESISDEDALPWCELTPPAECSVQSPEFLVSDELAVVVRSESSPNLKAVMTSLEENGETFLSHGLTDLLEKWIFKTSGRAAFAHSVNSLILHALLRPSPLLIDSIARSHSALLDIVPSRLRHSREGRSRGYIAVHARIGYGLGEGVKDAYAKRFNLTAQGASLHLVAACLARTAAEEALSAELPVPHVFYIATDTPEFSHVFRNEIERWSKGAAVKEMGRKVMHSNKMNDASLEDREAFIMTGAELFFLSAGERLVSLPSWFANLARYLGDVPHREKRVPECVQDAKSF